MWIPNHPKNWVIYQPHVEEWEWRVSDLIDSDFKRWRSELIIANFHKDDAEAILRIPLSHRAVLDSIIWLPNKNGRYPVKSGYHVAKQILRQDDWAESSSGPIGI